ncbi:Unknown protein [Striga hermonthica]|uniref:Peptidase A1 domain-containing protein n=1 Tax=Striga hermonthica TaxID=68872 RepID=A0A9N7NCI0_STRHE|nr:Unknown protein [Striga hermonthica]
MMMKRLSKYSSAALVVVIVALLISLVPLSSSTSFSVELIDPANPKHPFYDPRQLNTIFTPPINTPVLTLGWQYYVSFSVGSQAVQLLAAMDLASDLTWIQCTRCNPCSPLPNGDHDFEPQSSKTYSPVPCSRCLPLSSGSSKCSGTACSYSVGHADGSYSSNGALSTDWFKLGKTNVPHPIHFGCGNANTGLSGVVGLGEGFASIVGQLNQRTFSYWLVPSSSILTFGGPTAWGRGTLTLPMVKGPRNGPPGYYLYLLGVSVEVNNSPRTSPPYIGAPMLVNPQTTVTRLPSVIYNFLKQQVINKVHGQLKQKRDPTRVFDLCYGAKTNNDANLPETITLNFQGGSVSLPRVNMFAKLDNVDVVCLAALPAQKNAVAVYGSFAQTNFGVGFNLEPPRTVSFRRVTKRN